MNILNITYDYSRYQDERYLNMIKCYFKIFTNLLNLKIFFRISIYKQGKLLHFLQVFKPILYNLKVHYREALYFLVTLSHRGEEIKFQTDFMLRK